MITRSTRDPKVKIVTLSSERLRKRGYALEDRFPQRYRVDYVDHWNCMVLFVIGR